MKQHERVTAVLVCKPIPHRHEQALHLVVSLRDAVEALRALHSVVRRDENSPLRDDRLKPDVAGAIQPRRRNWSTAAGAHGVTVAGLGSGVHWPSSGFGGRRVCSELT
jgi:hypothetical protein